jgi:hypothetical protein
MSSPLLVKISRDGKEIGTYEAKEAVRLLGNETLKETDFYWHEGMTEWAPLSKLQASEDRRQLAERALKQKQDTARAESSAKEAKAILESQLKAEAEAKKPKPFVCHCCKESFQKPLGCVSEDSESTPLRVIAFLVIGFSLLIGIGFGVAGIVVLGVSGISIIVVLEIQSRLPSLCPHCKSTNFSRPEKTDEL